MNGDDGICKKKTFDKIFSTTLAHSYFDNVLSVDLHIPILFLNFDFDKVEISDTVCIERMSDPFQLARYPILNPASGVFDSVLQAATHCLVLKNFYLNNRDYFSLKMYISNPEIYPLTKIDNFFAAIRIIKGIDTGYCQLLLRPINWAADFKGDLPSLEGTSINAYPSKFEKHYWQKLVPEIDKDSAKEIGLLFLKLEALTKKSVKIAVDRLNLCYLRDIDEDAILDATIGLESIFSDDNRQEMTHKLAMRVGALAKVEDFFKRTPYQVFKDIKKIYSYRSAIVHGSESTEKLKKIKVNQDSVIPTNKLAVDYLRLSIKAVINNPDYQNPSQIDESLLLCARETESDDI